MKKKFGLTLSLIMLVLCVLLLASCGKDARKDIIGTWWFESEDGTLIDIMQYTFSDDGTFKGVVLGKKYDKGYSYSFYGDKIIITGVNKSADPIELQYEYVDGELVLKQDTKLILKKHSD